MMLIKKWASAILAVVILGIVGAGVSLAAYRALHGDAGAAPAGLAVIAAEQPAAAKAQADKKTDAERFVGTWIFADGGVNGETLPVQFTTLARMVFNMDGSLTLNIVGEGKKGKFKIGAPGKIDLTAFGDELSPGIYKFDGDDRVTICFREGGDDTKRPTEYSADKKSRQTLFILRRAKPGEEKPSKDDLAKVGDIDKIREAAARAQDSNNFKQIGLAMHNYHDVYKALPAHAIYSKDGKTPLLSWRVAILPFLGHDALYKEFKLDEPWDSEHNKKLIVKMPKIYEPLRGAKKDPGLTHYQVFTGPDTPFNGILKIKLTEIIDGTSNTIMAVEAKDPVIWSKPADLPLPKDKTKLPALGGMFSNGFHVLMCDGSVRMMALEQTSEAMRPLISPRGRD